MVSEEQISEAVEILVREAQPEKVILFGSHARGDASEDSDVDFLVELASVPDWRETMVQLRRVLRPLRIPVDVVVVSSERIRSAWVDFPGTCHYDALREGKVLYAVDRASTASAA